MSEVIILFKQWLPADWSWIAWGALSFLFFGVISVLILVLYLKKMPEDYFIRVKKITHYKMPSLVAFNLLAIFMILMGLVMLFTPGQGLLTIITGLLIGQFPGKRKFLKKLTASPKVRHSLDECRKRLGAPPFLWRSPRSK